MKPILLQIISKKDKVILIPLENIKRFEQTSTGTTFFLTNGDLLSDKRDIETLKGIYGKFIDIIQ